ncbi:hypothetical protein CF327_g3517 [Tilletia walkeri]|nr:hypothetical protein CF327_g3517 [Tilletia walkeri]
MTTTAGFLLPSSSPPALDWSTIDLKLKMTTRGWQRFFARLIQLGKDVMLVAPTGAGKGILILILMLAFPELQWIVLVPLKALEVELAERRGSDAIYINEDHRDKALFRRFEHGEAKVVLLSPEMALSTDFMRIFDNAAFRKRLGGIILDEAHVVYDWGTKTGFREKFKELCHLRHQTAAVGLAMSGTMPPEHRKDVQRIFELRNHVVLDLGTNRPNICFRVSVMKHPPNSFLDLCAFPPELWPPQDDEERARPVSTIIYVNDKKLGHEMWKILYAWYEKAGYSDAVMTFNADVSEPHKLAARPLIQSSKILCVIATDALGMGSDMSAVKRIIQWGMDNSPSAILQRLGRAGRSPLTKAEGIILVEPWVTGKGARDITRQNAVESPDFLKAIVDSIGKQRCTRQALNALMEQPKDPKYSQEEIFGIQKGDFDSMVCCAICGDLDDPSVPTSFLPPEPLIPDSIPRIQAVEAEVRTRLAGWKVEMNATLWKEEVELDPLGAEAFLRDADNEDIVSNIAKVFHSIRHDDAPPEFHLTNFIRSRRRRTIIPQLDIVLRELHQRFIEEEEDAARRLAEQRRQREEEKDAAKRKRFAEKCDAKHREAEEKHQNHHGNIPRLCEACRTWNNAHPFDPVKAHGHNKRSAQCPARLKLKETVDAQPVTSGSNVQL